MAQIKYLDSRRIMGASGDTVETPTFEDDFTSYADQTAFNTAYPITTTQGGGGDRVKGNPTTNVIDAAVYGSDSSDNRSTVTYDLTSTSDTKWVLRTSITIVSSSTSSINYLNVQVGLSNNTLHTNASMDFIGFTMEKSTSGSQYQITDTDNDYPANKQDATFTKTMVDGETIYVEIIRTSATTYTVNLYSDSGYSYLIESKSGTCTSTTDSLRYFRVSSLDNENGGSLVTTINDWKFWNGITSVTSKPAPALSLSGCKAYYNFEQTGTEIAQSTANDFVNVYSSAQHSAGFKLNSASSALNGTTVDSVTFYLKKAGSPTGTAYAKIYNGTTLVETSTNSLDVSTLTTSYQGITFNFAGTTTLSNGYTVAYYYDGGDGSNYTQFNYSTTDAYDSTNTIMRRFASSAWSDITTGDAKFVLNPVLLTNIATTANGFADGLGSSADGTVQNITQNATGKLGSYAYTFNGTTSSSKVTLGSSYSQFVFLRSSNSTVSIWLKKAETSTTSFRTIFAEHYGSAQSGVRIAVSNNKFHITVLNSGSVVVISTTDFDYPQNTDWHHVVIKFDYSNSLMTVYLDGSSLGTKALGSTSSGNSSFYGLLGDDQGGDGNWYGDMDELALFSRALTSSEISALYNSGTGKAVNDSSLQAKPETNSIFIETDTAKRYWFDGTNWTPQHASNYTTDFSSSTGWTATRSQASITNNALSFSTITDGNNTSIAYELDANAGDTWTLKAKIAIPTQSHNGVGYAQGVYFGLSDSDQTKRSTETQDFIGMKYIHDNIDRPLGGVHAHNEHLEVTRDNMGSYGVQFGNPIAANTTMYIKITKESATTYKVQHYSNGSYTTLVAQVSVTMSVIPTGLRYIVFRNLDDNVNQSGGETLTIDDVVFTNRSTA